ncbi:MAG: hypothetical protein GY806_00315 [Gammaproteobacteria bacterium]|nr:hypothetical protein [Gammaproteobacteria bacterium]
MSLRKLTLIAFSALCCLSFVIHAELQDQGLNSIMQIIDKAIDDAIDAEQVRQDETEEQATARKAAAQATVANLSRTLGTLSYSRLQCGEAGVLAEFTQRVLRVAEENRDAMRDAFQEGFDKSKEGTELLSEDECRRLTESRQRSETKEVANVAEDPEQKKAGKKVEVVEPEPEEDPRVRLLRIAELSGQLAYKRQFCEGKKVFNRDYNEYISGVPDALRNEVKTAYWKGFKHGKRLNKNLTKSQCS